MPAPAAPAPRRELRLLDIRALAAMAIATALLMAVHYAAAITRYPFDAALYWEMANGLTSGHSIRGYLFPAILSALLSMGAAAGLEAIESFRLVSSLAYAAVLTLLVPGTCARLAGGEVTLARRLAPFILAVAVYPGLLLYPLSDLPALSFMWLSVYCMLACRDAQGRPAREMGLALLAGLAAGAAYNTRTVYLLAVLLAAFAALLQLRGRRHHLALAALGFALASFPQVLINQQVHGIASVNPAVAYGGTDRAEGRSLIVDQFHWGMTIQKYETSIANGAASPSVNYVDPAGVTLLARLCEEGPIRSVGDYVRAVARHPLEFLGIYSRHFINGIDVRDGLAYVTGSSATKTLESFGCITLFMVLVLAARARAAFPARADRALVPRDWLWPAALVLPALLILPGAMETRFMLPLMLYLFGRAAAGWSGAAITSELRQRPYLYFAMALAGYAVFFAVTTSTLANASPLAPPAFCPGT